MASPNADLEHLLIRLSTVSVVLHGLLAHLTAIGLLAPADVADIERFALALARDFQDHTASGPQVAGSRMEQDVHSFFSVLMPDDDARPGAEEV